MSSVPVFPASLRPPRRAAILCRTAAAPPPGEPDPCDEQLAICKDYASECNLEIVPTQVYCETASGRTVDRPMVRQLLAAGVEGHYDIVLVASLDRIARSPIGVLEFLKAAETTKVAVWSVDKGILHWANVLGGNGSQILNSAMLRYGNVVHGYFPEMYERGGHRD